MNIGVFGGSFDPPHVGHLAVAQDAQEALGLDRILFVPARVSPFKAGVAMTEAGVRAGMVERALAGHPSFEVWAGELERPAPSYTVDTLEELGEAFPAASFTLLMGADQWASFGDWKDPERILGFARIAVFDREGLPGREEGPAWPHVRVPVRRMDVSSSEIRERVARGRPIRFLVPESVRREIEVKRLYGTAAGTAERASRNP